jgi:hypothetical protein
MAPERSVLVKRKADDEPLEILYVDDHDPVTDSPRKRQHIFRLVPESEASPLSSPAPLGSTRAKSRDEAAEGAHAPKEAKTHGSNGAASIDRPRPRAAPRRFHMLKERVASSVLGLEQPRGTKRKPGAAQLVVFEEEHSKKLRSDQVPLSRNKDAHITSRAPTLDPRTAKLSLPSTDRLRKRPNASPAERLWRQASWSNLPSRSRSRDVSPLPHPSARGQSERRLAASEIASLELALELHAFSIEETERDKRRAAEAEVAAVTKPNVAVSKTTADAESDDEAYVYDRYVRCSSPSSDVAMRDDMGDELARDAGALGYLVIGSDDEAAWTAYLDGLDGEDADENEILEDDEDSNGKSSPSQPSAEDTSLVWNRRIRWLT